MQFLSRVIVEDLGDGRHWRLYAPLAWQANDRQIIIVPENHVTDFASTPRLVWWAFPRTAKYNGAAVVHDYLYERQHIDGVSVTRKQADLYFREAAWDSQCTAWQCAALYRGVRTGGWPAWVKYARRNSRAEKPSCEIECQIETALAHEVADEISYA